MPMHDKRKRPTPQKGCCPWSIQPKPDLKSRYSKLKYTAKTAYLRERSPCPHALEIFEISVREQEQKLFIHTKNSLKTII